MHTLNIIDNTLDQAPKTHEAAYQDRLDEMKDQIEKAFDQIIVMEDGSNDLVLNWLQKHQSQIPLERLHALQPGKNIVIELKREHKTANGWTSVPGMLKSPDQIPTFNAKMISRETEDLKPGETSTYLVFTREAQDPKFPHNSTIKLRAEQIHFPSENAMVSKGLVSHQELKGEAFLQAVE